MSYGEPFVRVIRAEAEDTASVVVIRFEEREPFPAHAPFAPSALYVPEVLGREAFQLHHLCDRKGADFTFETYDSPHPLPRSGERYLWRGWWLREAMDAACNLTLIWERRPTTETDACERCLFSWETIVDAEFAYRSSYGWITESEYHRVILDDFYRLRSARNRESAP